jgi:uncharacterized protein YcbK (DUF882 family)
MRLRYWGSACAAALLVLTAAAQISAQTANSRVISFHNIHNDETLTIEYKRGGRYLPEAMKRIDWILRDWRKNESTRMEPALVDLLWEMHTELGSKQPINIISGYRSRTTNNMLRRTVGGQASQSRHILGRAADVQFPDIPIKQLRYSALVRERGGVGYYPTSGTPFVHVDIDRVRAWPRLPRNELALLFPNGRTKHMPASGGPITPADVRAAQAANPETAVQIAAFHDMRRGRKPQGPMIASLGNLPRIGGGWASTTRRPAEPNTATPEQQQPPRPTAAPVKVAAAPPTPRLVSAPRIADRPARLSARPSDSDRRKLAQLATLAGMPVLVAAPTLASRPARSTAEGAHSKPSENNSAGNNPAPLLRRAYAAATENARLAFASATVQEIMKDWISGWATAPARDEDHPDESAYRPFPLAPFLTTTSSIDDPALVQLVRPDFARTGELFDVTRDAPSMTLRPGRRIARIVWADDRAGKDSLGQIAADVQKTRTAGAAARTVQTQASDR